MNPIDEEGNIDFDKLIQSIGEYGKDIYLCLFNVDFLIFIVDKYRYFNEETEDIVKNKIICYFEKHLYNTSYMRGWNILCEIWELGVFPIIQETHKFTISYLLQQNTKSFTYNLTLTIGLLKCFNPKYKDYLYATDTGDSIIYCILYQDNHEYLKHINKEIKFKKSDILNHVPLLCKGESVCLELAKHCDFDLLDYIQKVKLQFIKYGTHDLSYYPIPFLNVQKICLLGEIHEGYYKEFRANKNDIDEKVIDEKDIGEKDIGENDISENDIVNNII